MLSALEYCPPVRMSGAASLRRLFDRVVSRRVRLNDGLMVCDLDHLDVSLDIVCFLRFVVTLIISGKQYCLLFLYLRVCLSCYFCSFQVLDVLRSRTE